MIKGLPRGLADLSCWPLVQKFTEIYCETRVKLTGMFLEPFWTILVHLEASWTIHTWNSMEHKTFCSGTPSVFRSCGCWEVWMRVLFELDCCCKPRWDQRFLISGKLMPGLILDGPLFSGDNIPIIVMTVLLKSRKSSISIFSHVAEGYLLDSSPATIFWFIAGRLFV